MALVAMGVLARPGFVRAADDGAAARARAFVAMHEATVRPLEIAVARLWWDANISGKERCLSPGKEEAETRLQLRLADPAGLCRVESDPRRGRARDPLLARQIEVLYLHYLAKQLDPELFRQITAKENALEKAFNTFYGPGWSDKELTENDVRRVLQRVNGDVAKRKAAWEASKAVGPVVRADFLELACPACGTRRRKNSPASPIIFAIELASWRADPAEFFKLFDQLDG